MNDKLGVVEFFTMEAGEYLERLDALVSRDATPDVREFQRLTRALRGAAIMANQEAIAGAAGAFEQVARAVKEGSRQWDEATRQLATRAVDDLKVFVRRVRDWSEDDAQKARDLTAALEAAIGRPVRVSRPGPKGPDAGTRAFIAREGASLASALDRAARTLARNPLAHDPLQQILNVMQPLRGLASLADVPPMPDLLEGIERAVNETGRRAEPHPLASEVLDAAARALTEATKAVASAGRADPDSPTVREFAGLLDRFLGFDRPLVPIESLYHDDPGPHVVEQGTAPASRERLGAVELVAHGEHLRQVADGLAHANTSTQRQLRVQGLAGTFRALEEGVGGPLAEAALAFSRAARNAVAAGRAQHDPDGLAARLREAGDILSRAAQGEAERLALDLKRVTARFEGVEAVPPPTAPGPPPAPAAPRRPMAPSAAAPTPATAPAESDEGDGDDDRETADLTGSWIRYERYRDELGLGDPSVEELLAGPAAAPAAASSPPVASPPPPAEPVPMAELLYRGPAALERARSLQPEIRAALARGETPTALIEEVLDLVDLGLGTDA